MNSKVIIETPYTQTQTHTEQKLKQEEKNGYKRFKENYVWKETGLSSPRNQNWKTVKAETKKR